MIAMSDEFEQLGALPRKGLTSVEAERLLREVAPEVRYWSCWEPENADINGIVSDALAETGQVGAWHWHRLSVQYPRIWYITPVQADDDRQPLWTGLIRITGPDDAEFLLFSFLSSNGKVGGRFMVSTSDARILDRFCKEVCEHFRNQRRAKRLFVDVVNGPDFEVPLSNGESICLPDDFQEDIERQVMTFFRSRAVYDRMHIPYRRGLLFAGPPGCGKTMMVRQLMRATWREFTLRYWTLQIRARTDDDDVIRLFHLAHKSAPGIIVLEDLDGLTNCKGLCRSTLLSQMDGLAPQQGILVLATTNHPEDIDPALAHRPSRFDRVWRFDLPDNALRLTYLEKLMPKVNRAKLCDLAGATSGWSFAYLKELRTSAAILAIQDGRETVEESDLDCAEDLLSAQFESGRKNHFSSTVEEKVGFGRMEGIAG